jgi:hypothetical protein
MSYSLQGPSHFFNGPHTVSRLAVQPTSLFCCRHFHLVFQLRHHTSHPLCPHSHVSHVTCTYGPLSLAIELLISTPSVMPLSSISLMKLLQLHRSACVPRRRVTVSAWNTNFWNRRSLLSVYHFWFIFGMFEVQISTHKPAILPVFSVAFCGLDIKKMSDIRKRIHPAHSCGSYQLAFYH